MTGLAVFAVLCLAAMWLRWLLLYLTKRSAPALSVTSRGPSNDEEASQETPTP